MQISQWMGFGALFVIGAFVAFAFQQGFRTRPELDRDQFHDAVRGDWPDRT